MKGLITLSCLLLLIAGGDTLIFLYRPLFSQAANVTLAKGEPASRFIQQLESNQLVSENDALRLKWIFRLTAIDQKLQAGEYQIESGMNPLALIQRLKKGEVVQYKITFVEGWTFKQIKAALAENQALTSLLGKEGDSALMAALGQAGHQPEGRFFPDTYFFTKGQTDKMVLLRAMNKMDKQLALLWEKRDKNSPFKQPYEGLILASIIEKEASWDAERPMISGVLHNRLKRNMKLQCDPTVIYGLGEAYQGDITRAHLRQDTPYNTYLHKGLPPTPIAAPGLTALEAAFQPETTEALFFVSNGDGSHRFSKTLKAHNKAVHSLQRGAANE